MQGECGFFYLPVCCQSHSRSFSNFSPSLSRLLCFSLSLLYIYISLWCYRRHKYTYVALHFVLQSLEFLVCIFTLQFMSQKRPKSSPSSDTSDSGRVGCVLTHTLFSMQTHTLTHTHTNTYTLNCTLTLFAHSHSHSHS